MNRGQYDAVFKHPRMSKSNIQFTFFLSIADTEAKNSHRQRIQRLMQAFAPAGTRRTFPLKVCLVYLIQNACHGLLDDFVFQHRYAQRALPPVAFQDVHPPGGLRSIRPPMHPVV